jgi:flagellar basal-body rod protein FlgG
MRLGVFVDTIYTDFGNGALETTRNEFDLAVVGDGFFVVAAEDELGNPTECYTRNGSLTVLDGVLMTKDGYAVMGQSGIINIPSGNFVVLETGAVLVNGEFVDNIRMVSFNDNQSLRKYKDNLYNTTDESQIIGFQGTVQQGALEMSNVNTVREMVDMITTHRHYEANQRVITTIDQSLSRAVNDIAKR